MRVIYGKELSVKLRAAADAADKRLWIASPYVGGWAGNVRRVLGTAWQHRAKDIRLLTDVGAGGAKKSTLLQFGRRGAVRSLLGLHAKIYIADQFVLVTSANLTGTAFSKRHEFGVVLTGADARRAIQIFKHWWGLKDTTGVDPTKIVDAPGSGKDPGERKGPGLPVLHALPRDAKDVDLPTDLFGDYDRFLISYGEMMAEYFAVQRIWKQTPRHFETDGFLNYLYRHAPGTPSRKYAKKKPRVLSPAMRRTEIARYARNFARQWRGEGIGDEDATWRTDRAREVRRLLNKNVRSGISRQEFGELLLQTNSMHFYRFNLAKAVSPTNHTIGEIRHMLRHLMDQQFPIQRRMADCSGQIIGVGKSAIQEIVGFCWPEKYPLRNTTANAGLRFLGFDVRVG